MVYNLYFSSLALSTAISLALIFFFWRRRAIRGAADAAWLMVTATVWSLGYILQLLFTSLPSMVVATDIQYIGIVFLPLAWFTFSLRYTGRDSWLNPKSLTMLSIIPVATLILVWTSDFHGIMWYGRHLEINGPFINVAKSYGPWFWLHTSYSYALIAMGMLTIARRLIRRPYLYRKQSLALIAVVLVPLISNVLYVFGLLSIYDIDFTPSAFTISGLIMMWGLFRSRLFDVVPIAYESIMEASGDGIVILDVNNRVIDMNRTAEIILDIPVSRAVGNPYAEVFRNQPELTEMVSGFTEDASEISVQKDNVQRYYKVHVSPLNDKHGELIGRMLYLIDNTDYRRSEARRKELEIREQLLGRLSTVGEMAAGIAHEVNNPLATVLGYSDLLLKRDLPDEIRQDLEIIDKSAKRASDILNRLLEFSGSRTPEFEHTEINRIIETAIEFRKHSLKNHNVEIVTHLAGGLPRIVADGSQLLEVFLNLIMNAEASMAQARNGGTLTISTKKADNSILITVQDDGEGIRPENIGKIFDPFFTTKKIGGGTGLGLSICHGIIASHGGDISVQSEPGKGATFTIRLPLSQAVK
jgi:signal transduction histidine kinase